VKRLTHYKYMLLLAKIECLSQQISARDEKGKLTSGRSEPHSGAWPAFHARSLPRRASDELGRASLVRTSNGQS
jgi:hypothetical protein